MKILKKNEVAVEEAKRRKEQIDEGLNLAKKIDALRETFAKEELHLNIFRKESVQIAQNQIDSLIKRKTELEKEVKNLEERRILSKAPLDLKTEWLKVKADKVKLGDLSTELLERETNSIAKEATLETKDRDLFNREEVIKEKENLTTRYLKEAETAWLDADKIKTSAEKLKDKVTKELKDKEQKLLSEEHSLALREVDLENALEQLEADRKEIENEKLHIASQQETLRQAWENIKKLSNK